MKSVSRLLVPYFLHVIKFHLHQNRRTFRLDLDIEIVCDHLAFELCRSLLQLLLEQEMVTYIIQLPYYLFLPFNKFINLITLSCSESLCFTLKGFCDCLQLRNGLNALFLYLCVLLLFSACFIIML